MDPVGYIFKPPASKQTPLPTNESQGLSFEAPLYVRWITIGSFYEAFPTAYANSSPA
jgi:hypothetical protein